MAYQGEDKFKSVKYMLVVGGAALVLYSLYYVSVKF